MDIKRNIETIQAQLAPKGCRLIAVSKTQPAEVVLQAYHAGQRVFGENKVQELVAKQESLPKDIEWHLIGHLQSNKVKFVAPFVSLIHSVDSEKLMDEIEKQGKKIDRRIRCLLQVHIASEDTKFGFDRSEVLDIVASNKPYSFLSVIGLMGMATFTADADQIRREFRGLKQLFDEVRNKNAPSFQMRELSMGMTGDFKIALEEGSTLVRIGTAIFGDRNL